MPQPDPRAALLDAIQELTTGTSRWCGDHREFDYCWKYGKIPALLDAALEQQRKDDAEKVRFLKRRFYTRHDHSYTGQEIASWIDEVAAAILRGGEAK